MLRVIDNRWRDHLYTMDYLRESVGLRTMAERDPLIEYQREAFELFNEMIFSFKEELLRYMYHVKVVKGRSAPACAWWRGRPEAAGSTPGASVP